MNGNEEVLFWHRKARRVLRQTSAIHLTSPKFATDTNIRSFDKVMQSGGTRLSGSPCSFRVLVAPGTGSNFTAV